MKRRTGGEGCTTSTWRTVTAGAAPPPNAPTPSPPPRILATDWHGSGTKHQRRRIRSGVLLPECYYHCPKTPFLPNNFTCSYASLERAYAGEDAPCNPPYRSRRAAAPPHTPPAPATGCAVCARRTRPGRWLLPDGPSGRSFLRRAPARGGQAGRAGRGAGRGRNAVGARHACLRIPDAHGDTPR